MLFSATVYKHEAKYWLGKNESWADPAKLIGVGHWVGHWRGAEGHPTFPTLKKNFLRRLRKHLR